MTSFQSNTKSYPVNGVTHMAGCAIFSALRVHRVCTCGAVTMYRIKYQGVRGGYFYDDVEAKSADEATRKFMREHPGIAMAQCIGMSP